MPTVTISAQVENKTATEADWIASNPIILKGELALVQFGSRYRFKIGDGVSTFSALDYNVFDASAIKGLATATTNPGTPALPEIWAATAGVTYTNFRDSGGTAITIPATSGGNTVISPRLIFTGSFWVPDFATQAPPAAGANGTNGNTVLNGTVDPISSVGNNGDFYINKTALTFFGPKAAGAWPAGTALGSAVYTYITSSTGKNLFDKTGVIDGQYIDTGGSLQGTPTPGADFSTTPEMNVTGLTNVIVSGAGLPLGAGWSYYHFLNSSGAVVGHGEYYDVTLPWTVSVPAGAVSFKMNIRYNQSDKSYYNTLQVESGVAATTYAAYVAPTTSILTINGHALHAENGGGGGGSTASWLNGLKVNFDGDSIMALGTIPANIATRTGCTTANQAISGVGFIQGGSNSLRSRAVATAAVTADFLCVMAGTNDWGVNQPLGTYGTWTDDTQFYSAVYNTMRLWRAGAPNRPILMVTPYQRYLHSSSETRASVNTLGLTLVQYVHAIQQVAELFSIKCINAYAESGITLENIDTWTSDGLHVNASGAVRMGGYITPFMNAMNF